MMTILGVDPGTARIGWGVIQEHAGKITARAYGCITTEKTLALPDRLHIIYTECSEILREYTPDVMSVEDLFFSKNVTTAIAVGQARGVILLTAAEQKIPVYSYSPNTVKKTICGSGSADKHQVEKMITSILRLKEIPKPDDTADALAIAATHGFSYKLKAKLL